MVNIQIDADEETDKEVELFKAINRLDNKANAVEKMLKEYIIIKRGEVKKK